MAKLYELTGEMLTLMNALYEEDLEESEILARCEELEMAIEDKAEGYAMIIRSLEADIDALDSEMKRLSSRKASISNKVKWLKYNLEASMRATGNLKFKTALFSFGIQKNPPAVKIDDEKAFLDWIQENTRYDFLTYRDPDLNKAAIKEAITKDGEVIPFVEIVQSERLSIR